MRLIKRKNLGTYLSLLVALRGREGGYMILVPQSPYHTVKPGYNDFGYNDILVIAI